MKYIRFLGLFISALLLVVSCDGASDFIVDLLDGTEKNYFVENDLVDIPSTVTANYEATKALVSTDGGKLVLKNSSGDTVNTSDPVALDAALENLSSGLAEAMNTPTLVKDLNKSTSEELNTAAKAKITEATGKIDSYGLLTNSKVPDEVKSTISDIQTKLNNIVSSSDSLTTGDVLQVQIVTGIVEEINNMVKGDNDKFSGNAEEILKDPDVKKLIDYSSVVVTANDKLSGKINVFNTDFVDKLVNSIK